MEQTRTTNSPSPHNITNNNMLPGAMNRRRNNDDAGCRPRIEASQWDSLIAELEEDCKDPAATPVDGGGGSGAVSGGGDPMSSSLAPHVAPRDDGPFIMDAVVVAAAPLSFSIGTSDHRRPLPVFSYPPASSQSNSHSSSCGVSTDDLSERSPPGTKPPPPLSPLLATMPLREWIVYHAARRTFEAKPTVVSSSNAMLRQRGINGGADRKYLESAARVALSLATELGRPELAIHPRDVAVDNVVVINTQEGASEFIKTNREGRGSSPRSSSQRPEIAALGRLFYTLFTRGATLPARTAAARRSGHDAAAAFGNALNIDRDQCNASRESSGSGEHAYERSRQRRRRDDARHNARATLREEGMPASVCHLVEDMLENEDGGFLSNDMAITTLDDVVSDLTQMVDNPTSFLHDSVLRRWKPVVPNRMYCRDAELRRALDVAQRISREDGDNDAMEFGGDAGPANPSMTEVLMVSGHSGGGKSCLVGELIYSLERRGWRCIQCKFDRLHPQPLSFIMSAFDRYFERKKSSDVDDNDDDAAGGRREDEELRDLMLKTFGGEDLSILCHLVPSVAQILSEGDPSHETRLDQTLFDLNDAVASTGRLHYLFGMLLQVISQRPLIFFLDDLHWADRSSLDLLMAFIQGIGSDDDDSSSMAGCNVLFVGSYRVDEVTDSHPLATSLRQVRSLSHVTFTEIELGGLSSDDVNVMVSEALCYPRRISRSLSNLIHEKTAGNPMFVRELLNDLAMENLLNYSLSLRKWEWDEDEIRRLTVSNGVAEFLTRKLLRLPNNVLSALRIASIFGSEVSVQVLMLVRDTNGNIDILSDLSCAAAEGLVKITNETCSFVHDMIQQSVSMGIEPSEKLEMLNTLSEALLSKTSDIRSTTMLFIIVNLINRIDGRAKAANRLRYARLNLAAGEKAILIPDFGSASKYLEAGIEFLGDRHWADCYDLSLHLYKNAALVQYAQGKTDLMTERLTEVLRNAKNFDDKCDSLALQIHSLTMEGTNIPQAFDMSISVLEQLGESFPKTPTKEVIAGELFATKNELSQYAPSSVSTISPMINPQKSKAMVILPLLLVQCYRLKSHYYPLVACRMAKLTLQYVASTAVPLKDMTEGYKLGKYALAITTNKNMPEVYRFIYGVLNIWKEPMQAALPELMLSYKMGMKSGQITDAFICSMFYSYRAFFSGSKLSLMKKEMLVFIPQYVLYQRNILEMSLIPFSNAMARLEGSKCHAHETFDDDQILKMALAKNDLTVAETVVVLKMMCSFIMRDTEEAQRIVDKYWAFFEQHDGGRSLQFLNIYRYFYGGLVAFESYRRTREKRWEDIGECCISKFEHWTKECSEWNFLNKLLILRAEHQHATGRIPEAKATYDLAIASARDHRFKNEEAISCELASAFYRGAGAMPGPAAQLMRQAIECYESWGATKKVEALLQSLRCSP